ncbi:MAG: Eco57I restriction-modification methylase domain-containing protein [Promethearchaeota archaeon]
MNFEKKKHFPNLKSIILHKLNKLKIKVAIPIQNTSHNQEKEDNRAANFILEHNWYKIFQDLLYLKNQDDELKDFTMDDLYEYFLRYKLKGKGTKENPWIVLEKEPKERIRGKFYTPSEVIQFIIAHVELNRNKYKSLKLPQSEEIDLKIADIACGTGKFLLEWELYKNEQDIQSNEQLFGFDTDSTAIKIANQLNLENATFLTKDALFEPKLNKAEQFNVILGNPPYIESRAIDDEYWKKLRINYTCAYKKFDLAVVFLERILHLLRPGGWAGLIISNKWLVSDYGEKVRHLLLTQSLIHEIIDISHLPIFKKVSTYPIIIVFQKKAEFLTGVDHEIQFSTPNFADLFSIPSKDQSEKIWVNLVHQKFFMNSPKYIISTALSAENLKLLTYMKDLPHSFLIGSSESPYLLRKGIHTGNIKNKIITTSPPLDDPHYKHAVTSRLKVDRYNVAWQGLWVNYNPDIFDKSNGDYGALREEWIFESNPKLLIKLFGTRIQAAFDGLQYYTNNSLILLIPKPDRLQKDDFKEKILSQRQYFSDIEQEFYYLLGVLNSKLISSYYRLLFCHTHVRGNYLQYYIKDLNQIPLINPTKENSKLIEEIALLARDLETQHQHSKVDPKEIMVLENKLDERIYLLYGIKVE